MCKSKILELAVKLKHRKQEQMAAMKNGGGASAAPVSSKAAETSTARYMVN